MSRFTVFGATGFIGSSLVAYLREQGHEVALIARDQWPASSDNLGHVIYAIGLTADFRSRRLDVADSHVHVLTRILRELRFDSLLYLSSTRVYAGGTTSVEDASLTVSPLNEDHLYNVSKIMGESLVLSDANTRARVVRLSNVIGAEDRSDNFLNAVIAEAIAGGKVMFRTAPDSARDYIGIADACGMLAAISTGGRRRIYNVASGRNVSNGEIARLLGARHIDTAFQPNANKVTYPVIDIGAIRQEFNFQPASFEETFDKICALRKLEEKSIHPS